MTQERSIVSFTIGEPFDVALRMLRRALAREGLRVPCEVDTSARLKSELGIGLKNGITLYVDTPMLLLEATVLNIAGSLFVPEPVVLSSNGSKSAVLVRSIRPLPDAEFPTSVREAIVILHERILKAIQTVARLETPFEPVETDRAVPA
jgi:hypothetical protein